MIAFGASGATPKQRMAQIAAGLGVLPGRHRRPALPAAEPARPAAHPDRPEPVACSASASTRTRPASSGPTTSWRSSGAAHHDRRRRRIRDRRLGGPRPPAADDQQRRPALAAGRLPVRPPPAASGRDARRSTRCPAARPPRADRPTQAAGAAARAGGSSGPEHAGIRTAANRDGRARADGSRAGPRAAQPSGARSTAADRGRRGPRRPCASSRRASCAARTTGRASRSSGMLVDLGVLEEYPSNTIPGFTDALVELMPTLEDHACSLGRRGGFITPAARRDVGRATSPSTSPSSSRTSPARTSATARPARPGRTASTTCIYEYREEAVGLEAGPDGGRARQPPRRARRSRRRVRLRAASWSGSSGWPSARRSARRRRRSSTRRSAATSRSSGSTATRSSSSATASTSSASGRR